MAFKISPSVDITEVDLTLGVAAVATSIAGFTGAFQWGPVLDPVTVSSEQEYAAQFGKPNNDVGASWLCGANFLAYSNNMKVVRVAGDDAKNAVSDATEYFTGVTGTTVNLTNDVSNVFPYDIIVFKNSSEMSRVTTPSAADEYSLDLNTGLITFFAPLVTTDKVMVQISNFPGIRINNESDFNSQNESGNIVYPFVARYPGILGNGLVVQVAIESNYDNWQYKNAFDGSPSTEGLGEAHAVVIDGDGVWTGTPGTILEKYPFISIDPSAKYDDGSSAYVVNLINTQSKYIWCTSNLGAVFDELTYSPVRKEGADTSTIILSDIGDEDYVTSAKIIGRTEVFANYPAGGVLDNGTWNAATNTPALTNRMGSVGEFYTVSTGGAVDFGAGSITFASGDYVVRTANAWTKVLAATVPGTIDTITLSTTPSQLVGATVEVFSSINAPLVEGVDYTISGNVITLDNSYNTGGFLEQPEQITINITNLVVPATISPSYQGGQALVLTTQVSQPRVVGATYIATSDIEAEISNIYSTKLGGGEDDNISVDLIDGYTLFQDVEDIDIQLMIAGVATQTEAKWAVDNIGETRKDCVVFVSPTREDVVNVNNPDTVLDNLVQFYGTFPSSSYAFADSGWKYQYDKYNDVYRWVPLCGDMAGLAARTDSTNDPWWAFGGYNRGQVKNVVKLAWSPKKTFRDELFRNRINAVITERGEGTVLLGDKTMLSRPSAFDAVNVRRLFITLEKAIATSAKYLLFEFNDEFTQAQFRNLVEPFLRDVKGRRGIEDFRVICDDSNNTGEVKQRREFVGDIYIKPNYAIRYVQLNFIAVRSDVSFNEVGA